MGTRGVTHEENKKCRFVSGIGGRHHDPGDLGRCGAPPKLFQTSGTATDNGLRQTLTVVRDAIDLYAADNAGALPPTVNLRGGFF